VHAARDDDPLYVEDDLPLRDSLARAHRVATVTGYERALGTGEANAFRSEVLVYDRAGRRVSHERLDAAGAPVRRRVYERGRLVAELAYDRRGEVNYRIEVRYRGGAWSEKKLCPTHGAAGLRVLAERDENGRLLHAIFSGASGERLRTERYEYDEDGRLVRVDCGALGARRYAYGPDGEPVRKTVDAPGQSGLGETYELEHDERGLLTLIVRPHLSETRFAFEYAG
jgi:hypothetical protein